MKLALLLGVVLAGLLHSGVLLFGGVFFLDRKKDAGSLQPVDLLSNLDAEDEAKKDKQEPEERPEEESEDLETEAEQPPDAAEILSHLDDPVSDLTPALEAVSLSAIEAALSGLGGDGDFTEALSFASGGRIGGTGKPGALDEKMEDAFSLSEIDQKPRPVYQESPLYPSEMRGKKVEGLVTVIFVVDPSGKVQDPRVEKSSHTVFESPALKAVKRWKFEPAVRAGQRVACKMRVPIRFPAS